MAGSVKDSLKTLIKIDLLVNVSAFIVYWVIPLNELPIKSLLVVNILCLSLYLGMEKMEERIDKKRGALGWGKH